MDKEKLKEELTRIIEEESKKDVSTIIKEVGVKQTVVLTNVLAKAIKELKSELLEDRKKISETLTSGYVTEAQQNKILGNIDKRLQKLEELENKTKEVIVKNQVKIPKFPEFPKEIEVKNFPESDAPKIVQAIKELGQRLKAAITAFIKNQRPNEAIPVVLVDREKKQFYNAMFNMGGVSVEVDEVEEKGHGSVGTFRKTISNAGTAEQLPNHSCKRVVVQALSDNSGAIEIGDSNVVASEGTQRGIRLFPTQSIELFVSNTNLIYIDAENNGDGVSVYYEA